MIDRIAKLIDVKSISTLTLVGTFVFLAVTHEISGEQFLTIFTTVIAFYFGTQNGKSKQTNVEKSVETVESKEKDTERQGKTP